MLRLQLVGEISLKPGIGEKQGNVSIRRPLDSLQQSAVSYAFSDVNTRSHYYLIISFFVVYPSNL